MEKKAYLNPAIKVMVINATQLMAASGDEVTDVNNNAGLNDKIDGGSGPGRSSVEETGIWK